MGLISKETCGNLGTILLMPYYVLTLTALSYFSQMGGWEEYLMAAWSAAMAIYIAPLLLLKWRSRKSPPKDKGTSKEGLIPDELLVLGAVILLPLYYDLANLFIPNLFQKVAGRNTFS